MDPIYLKLGEAAKRDRLRRFQMSLLWVGIASLGILSAAWYSVTRWLA